MTGALAPRPLFVTAPASTPGDLVAARTLTLRWLGLAVLSLVLAGCCSLFLIVGRMPPFDRLIDDPLLFRRLLVVHVDLAMVVWFPAFIAALFAALPAQRAAGSARGTAALALAVAGVALLLAGALPAGAQPVLANYVPAVDHPVFVAGLTLFGLGIALQMMDGHRLDPRQSEGLVGLAAYPAATRPGLRCAALILLLAVLTFATAAVVTPRDLPPEQRYELLAWGGGHVLQFASVAAMLALWSWLLSAAAAAPVVPRAASLACFVALVLAVAPAPLLAGQGTTSAAHREAFTQLMQLGIFPPVLVYLGLCLRGLHRAHRAGAVRLGDPRVLTFLTSAALTLLGFVLGALIRGSTTLVPAHYHAAIGAVTAAFMGAALFLLLPRLGAGPPARAARFQPLLFGAGQAVFALGFGVAGAGGMARKVYGAEQAGRSALETTGLVVMGAGGVVAVIGGLLFLTLALGALRRALHRGPSPCTPFRS